MSRKFEFLWELVEANKPKMSIMAKLPNILIMKIVLEATSMGHRAYHIERMSHAPYISRWMPLSGIYSDVLKNGLWETSEFSCIEIPESMAVQAHYAANGG